MTCIPGLGLPKSLKKLQGTTFRVEDNSRTFQGLAQKPFQVKVKFKDFSRLCES